MSWLKLARPQAAAGATIAAANSTADCSAGAIRGAFRIFPKALWFSSETVAKPAASAARCNDSILITLNSNTTRTSPRQACAPGILPWTRMLNFALNVAIWHLSILRCSNLLRRPPPRIHRLSGVACYKCEPGAIRLREGCLQAAVYIRQYSNPSLRKPFPCSAPCGARPARPLHR